MTTEFGPGRKLEDQVPTDGADSLFGDIEPDRLVGLGGNDLLVGSIEKDTLLGGEGDDTLVGGGYAEGLIELLLTEHTGLDIVYITRPDPSGLAERLSGGEGDDVIVGGNWQDYDEDGAVDWDEVGRGTLDLEYQPGFANSLWGGLGNDYIYGANGFDTIGGGAGNDTISGGDSADIVYGGTGDDLIFGGAGDPAYFHQLQGEGSTITESLFGGEGNDTIWGGEGVDIAWGGAGRDRLLGEEGSDTLVGGAGNDWIAGDEGDDVLTGGADADGFMVSYDGSIDHVTDFNVEEDQLMLGDYTQDENLLASINAAEETTLNGVQGLFVTVGDKGGLFLEGLTTADIPSIELVVFYPD